MVYGEMLCQKPYMNHHKTERPQFVQRDTFPVSEESMLSDLSISTFGQPHPSLGTLSSLEHRFATNRSEAKQENERVSSP
jgi:hypothetical protein